MFNMRSYSLAKMCMVHCSRTLQKQKQVTACSRFQSTLVKVSDWKVQTVQCEDTVKQFLENHDTFLIDCDGVLWKNDHVTPIPGIPQAIEKLHQLGKKVLYATNNSIVSRIKLKQKFQHHGFDASLDTIFSNGYASALFIKEVLNAKGKVYLVGGEGMKWELDQEGIENFGAGPDPDKPTDDIPELLSMGFENDVDAVLMGFDPHFSYNKLYKAASYLTNMDCHFIATNNIERGIFIGEHRRMPMTGTLVNAVAETANRKPSVLGKPHRTMFECLMKVHPDINRDRTVMIGDNLKADMGFAKSAGIASALVLTGTNQLEHVNDLPHLAPNFVMNSLVDIACKR